jgi:disulfide bond formation protein DsbB
MRSLRSAALPLAWIVSVVATLGSLYFSEIRHFVPCTMCWYQRIAMYPLIIILGIAAYRDDRQIARYILPISSLGILFAVYQILLQNIPGFDPIKLCSIGVPCSTKYVDYFGFISIPVMSLTAFVLITLLLSLVARGEKR